MKNCIVFSILFFFSFFCIPALSDEIEKSGEFYKVVEFDDGGVEILKNSFSDIRNIYTVDSNIPSEKVIKFINSKGQSNTFTKKEYIDINWFLNRNFLEKKFRIELVDDKISAFFDSEKNTIEDFKIRLVAIVLLTVLIYFVFMLFDLKVFRGLYEDKDELEIEFIKLISKSYIFYSASMLVILIVWTLSIEVFVWALLLFLTFWFFVKKIFGLIIYKR